jgi:hypothetical protein
LASIINILAQSIQIWPASLSYHTWPMNHTQTGTVPSKSTAFGDPDGIFVDAQASLISRPGTGPRRDCAATIPCTASSGQQLCRRPRESASAVPVEARSGERMTASFHGRVAYVTGGASGLGRRAVQRPRGGALNDANRRPRPDAAST